MPNLLMSTPMVQMISKTPVLLVDLYEDHRSLKLFSYFKLFQTAYYHKCTFDICNRPMEVSQHDFCQGMCSSDSTGPYAMDVSHHTLCQWMCSSANTGPYTVSSLVDFQYSQSSNDIGVTVDLDVGLSLHVLMIFSVLLASCPCQLCYSLFWCLWIVQNIGY